MIIIVIIDGKSGFDSSKRPIQNPLLSAFEKKIYQTHIKDKTTLLPNTATEPNVVFHSLAHSNCLKRANARVIE